MKRFEERISIDAPASTVFDYVSDFTKHGEWALHGLEVTREGDGLVGVGTTFSTVAKQFGTQREKSTITEITPGSVFAWDSTGALGRVHHSFTVSGDGGSTTLVKAVELTEPTFLARVMGWRLGRDIPKGLRSDLKRIKNHMESRPSA
jgi:uncharacterized membrane protein